EVPAEVPAEVPLAEPVSVFSFDALSAAFCPSAGAASAGSAGAAGACPAEFAEPAGSCCCGAIPAAGRPSQSAIASPQASRIRVPKELFPTLTKNARVGDWGSSVPDKRRVLPHPAQWQFSHRFLGVCFRQGLSLHQARQRFQLTIISFTDISVTHIPLGPCISEQGFLDKVRRCLPRRTISPRICGTCFRSRRPCSIS